jgi:hypothetical protein
MNKVILLRIFFVISVVFSIFVIYYSKVIKEDYFIYTNPEGPDVSDYFLLESE